MKKIVPTLTALLAASLFAGCAQQPAAPAAQAAATPTASKDATEATRAANRTVATQLPLANTQSFDDAKRRLGAIPDTVEPHRRVRGGAAVSRS